MIFLYRILSRQLFVFSLSLSQPTLQIVSPTLHKKNKNDSFMIIKKICEIKQKETTKHSTWKIKHRPSEKDSKK